MSDVRKATWKKELNSMKIQDKKKKHAFYMALHMIVELGTTLAKAKRSAAKRHGVAMTEIEYVVKAILGQEFFDARSKAKTSAKS
ncbi:hypothetical protein THMIRHAS_17140 [Thiosulfatimonas sediminis]|uniref:Uncharacterized protein n=1 Tax=Thiosulfatimonas sediminis TaxID=2675054 RepID=A0A6F8PW37_9GAMM|nr:hypothetical protein [Thiosulfatimonas sediminis]BBP46341.1 hypothetical protein THMIRHAS_17140 [Thiosulfatimonas sediminis]